MYLFLMSGPCTVLSKQGCSHPQDHIRCHISKRGNHPRPAIYPWSLKVCFDSSWERWSCSEKTLDPAAESSVLIRAEKVSILSHGTASPKSVNFSLAREGQPGRLSCHKIPGPKNSFKVVQSITFNYLKLSCGSFSAFLNCPRIKALSQDKGHQSLNRRHLLAESLHHSSF